MNDETEARTDTILFGDEVCFLHEDPDGFVFSDISIKPTLWLSKTSKSNAALPNFKGAVFEIIAPNKYKLSKRMLKYKRALESKNIPADDELRKLQRMAEAEKTDNVKEQARQLGRPLKYGQLVQLRHVLSGNYLRFSTQEAASTDIMNMTAELAPENSKQCYFRVMPRFKVQSEGDFVRVNDQIVLESGKTASQFLHISDEELPEEHIMAGQFEVDASVRKSTFVLHRHRKCVRKAAPMIRGNEYVHVLHKELDAFLSAEGNQFGFGIQEDVHLRCRKAARAGGAIESSAANTMWQIELEDATCGEPIRWVQLVRIRHVPTRKYLAVTSKHAVALVDAPDRNSTTFRLVPIIKDQSEVEDTSYCKIQHWHTSLWLHGSHEAYHLKQYASLKDEGMESLRWDTAMLRLVTALPDIKNDDAFVLQVVNDVYQLNVNYAMGAIPHLVQFIKRYENQKVTKMDPLVFQTMSRVMDDLFRFVSGAAGNSDRDRQKLFRQLRIVELLVHMLKVPFRTPAGFEHIPGFNKVGISMDEIVRFPKFKKLCQSIYDLLGLYLEGNSRKNELYIAKHIGFFQSQIGYDLHTPAMFMELVGNNQSILDRIDSQQIKSFVFWLRKTQDPTFMRFLGLLCVCDGAALSRNQRDVWENVSAINREASLLCEAQLKNNVVEFRMSKNDNWLSLEDFVRDKQRLGYLTNQINMMTAVCLGRTQPNLEEVARLITLETALSVLKNEGAPAKLRAVFADFVRVVFVDTGRNNRIYDNLSVMYLWETLSSKRQSDDPTQSITGERLALFPDVRDFVLSYITANDVIVHDDVDRNRLTAAILQLTSLLANFGYYKFDDIRKIVPPLFILLDGRNDLPSRKTTMSNEDADMWRRHDRLTKTPQNKVVVNMKYDGMVLLNIFFSQRTADRTLQFLADYKTLYQAARSLDGGSVSKVAAHLAANVPSDIAAIAQCLGGPVDATVIKAYLKQLDARTDIIATHHEAENCVEVLFDLARYDYTKMTTLAMSLVNRHFSKIQHLFEAGQAAQIILHKDAVRVYNEVHEKLPHVRRLMRTTLDREGEAHLVAIFTQFRDFCILPEDKSKPHQVNQQILFSAGILADIFAMLEKPVDTRLDEYKGMIKVYDAVFSFLAAFARREAKLDTDGTVRKIQQELFTRLDFFLERQVAIPKLALALVEVFATHEFCIKLKERHIHAFVTMLAQTRASELLTLLTAIVRVDDMPIKRNQTLVIKYMMQYRAETLRLVSDEENEERMRLLVEGGRGNLQGQDLVEMDYNVKLVRFLATCCEGENAFVESVCQNIFDVNELFEVLIHPDIKMNHKRPYLRFLLWAYLATASGPGQAADIDLNPKLWKFLVMLNAKIVEVMNKDLDHLLDTEDGKQDDITMREGVFTFIQEFYQNHYSKQGVIDQLCPEHSMVTSLLQDTLLDFYDRMIKAPLYADKRRLRRFLTVLMVFDLVGWSTEKQQQRYASIITSQVAGGSGPVNHALEKFKSDFAMQLDVVRSLRKFVANMEGSYRSDKTCPAYDIDPEALLGGLWRGEEFQQHIQAFVNYRPSSNNDFVGLKTSISHIVRSLRISLANFRTLSDREKAVQIELDVKHLRLLRAIITNEFVKLDNKVMDDSNEAIKTKIVEIQSALDGMEVATVAVELMSSPMPIVERAALRLLVMILHGGNPDVQHSFVLFFRGKMDEGFFRIVRDRLKESSVAIKEQRSLEQQVIREKQTRSRLMTNTLKKKSIAESSKNGKSIDGVEMATIDRDVAAAAARALNADDEDEGAIVSFKSIVGFVELLLRILQLLCENQNDDIKNYLRVQPDSINQYNLVLATLDYLHVIHTNVEKDSLSLTLQLLDTLVEFASGNQENQAQLFDGKVIDVLNSLFRTASFKGCDFEEVAELHGKGCQLVRTMVETNNREAQRLAQELSTALDLDAMQDVMVMYHPEVLRAQNAPLEADEAGFLSYMVFARLRDFCGPSFGVEWMIQELDEKKRRVLGDKRQLYNRIEYYRKNTASIEILNADGDIMEVYFRVRDREALTKAMMDDIRWSVDRSSPTEKIESFNEACEGMREHMRYYQRVMSNPLAKFLIINSHIVHYLILALTLAINILILATWQANSDNSQILPTVEAWYDPVITALGAVHIALSVIVVITHFLETPIRKAMDLLSFSHLYFIVFLVFSVVGIATDGYFYCFHLLHVICKNDILKRVLRSVTKNGISLLNVLMLAIIVIYVYAVISFAFLRDSFNTDDNLWCDNMWQCFLTSLTAGLQGSLHEALGPTVARWEVIGLRILFDLSFYIIVSVIGLNIVFGIIVDTFSELRDERYQAEEDMKNNCFICSLGSSEFEKAGVGFDHHRKHEHNEWNYLFFTSHVLNTEPTEYTASEAYVRELMDKNETSWFPIGRALCLQHDDDQMATEIRQIRTMVQSLIDRFAEEDRVRAENDERRRQQNA